MSHFHTQFANEFIAQILIIFISGIVLELFMNILKQMHDYIANYVIEDLRCEQNTRQLVNFTEIHLQIN